MAAEAYERGDQHAYAQWEGENGDCGEAVLRIEATRGASAGATAGAPPPSSSTEGPDINAYFIARFEQSGDLGCESGTWEASVPLDSFFFDPALSNARFTGVVQGCSFDVEWTGEGVIVPGSRHVENFELNPWRAGAGIEMGYPHGGAADLARIASARIETCFISVLETGHGSLAQGLRYSQNIAGARAD